MWNKFCGSAAEAMYADDMMFGLVTAAEAVYADDDMMLGLVTVAAPLLAAGMMNGVASRVEWN